MKLYTILARWSMALLSPFTVVSSAWAAAPAAHTASQGFSSMLTMLLVFAAVFYFLLIRPQSKRAKAQKQLHDSLHLGDEVLTSSGIIGRISKLRDNYLGLEIAKGTEIMVQKNAIAHVVPKGTLESN